MHASSHYDIVSSHKQNLKLPFIAVFNSGHWETGGGGVVKWSKMERKEDKKKGGKGIGKKRGNRHREGVCYMHKVNVFIEWFLTFNMVFHKYP